MALTTTQFATLTQIVYTSTNDSAVTFMSVCNRDAAARTVDIHVVKSGDAPDATNMVISQLSIAADDTYMLYGAAEKLLLENGDTIQVVVDANQTLMTAVVSSAQV